ncbi:hypothetical protein R6Q59_014919, partial [Mikania micrantha]
DQLRDAILLVFVNKQDLPNAMDAAEITDKLGMRQRLRADVAVVVLVLEVVTVDASNGNNYGLPYSSGKRNLRFSCDKMALTEKDVCGGKVKCQTENNDGKYGKQSFESFSEAVRLDMQNACALTHCGILYKDEGPLVEAAEKALDTYPSYKATTESMAIVSIDIGTSLKLAGREFKSVMILVLNCAHFERILR